MRNVRKVLTNDGLIHSARMETGGLNVNVII
jgi:hypothetical protein